MTGQAVPLSTGRNDVAGAQAIYLEILPQYQRTVGPEHPATVLVETNLAELYLRQRRLVEAEPLLTQVLAHRRRTHHSSFTATALSLASLYFDTNRRDQAARLAEEALAEAKAPEQSQLVRAWIETHPK